MTFLVDVNPPIYSVTGGEHQVPCLRLLEAIADGKANGRCSVAILEEVWHLELKGRLPQLAGQTERFHTIFSPLLPVTPEIIARALKLKGDGLGANDRVHVATCLENGIGTIVTADAAFDSIEGLERVDPLEPGAIDALLEGERPQPS